MTIDAQLALLDLYPFQGMKHCGMDDARNIARILKELAHRGLILSANTQMSFKKRWWWMGRKGVVLYHHIDHS